MVFWIFRLIFLILIGSDSIKSDIFSSVEHLSKLPKSKANIIKHIRSYILDQHEQLNTFEEKLNDFELLITKDPNIDAKKFIGHPINAFLMIKQLTVDYNSLMKSYINSMNERLEKLLTTINDDEVVPDQQDYIGSMVALLRLQDTYLLNSSQIQSGTIEKFQSIRPLNAFECFELGKVAHDKENYKRAVEWQIQALKQINEENDSTISKVEVMSQLANSSFKQGDVFKAIKISKEILNNEPKNQKIQDEFKTYKEALAETVISKLDQIIDKNSIALNDLIKNDNDNPYREDFGDYESLCRGNHSALSSHRSVKLKCRYVNHHPYLRIGPIKEEQVFDDPPIWVYHDVITEKQVKKLVELGTSNIERAKVIVSRNASKTADYRISKTGWLTPDFDPIINQMEYLVGAVTNFDMMYSEVFQINNYGIGGVYGPHYDFTTMDKITEADESVGRRLATWMFYIEAPELGGATVFPRIGARVEPISRSAVLWYNLYPSLNGDMRTLHAGCPVLVGSKWVSNLWIRANGQIFRRPCDLVKEDAFEI